jgi:hypothetical protein
MFRDLTGAVWCKSRRSHQQGECVEVAGLSDVVAVRDSKNPDGPKLVFGAVEWRAFVRSVTVGELDR